ncbi:hypothetical protein LNP74_09490 [Klebsiella pneumoniae subsp. pneumoniae]|nr:hypothetical protein [Klebsiella pneumoniae subsp. pneumoniae]
MQCLSVAGCRVIAEGRYNTPAQAAESDALRRVGGDRRLGDYPPEHICVAGIIRR